ncbi:MAG: hypothetical protein PWP52_868 [Bacteroidales bacterium]|jgi:hypothetical protein|nr:hypothetical protein [Bacteroidales bacterium]
MIVLILLQNSASLSLFMGNKMTKGQFLNVGNYFDTLK